MDRVRDMAVARVRARTVDRPGQWIGLGPGQWIGLGTGQWIGRGSG